MFWVSFLVEKMNAYVRMEEICVHDWKEVMKTVKNHMTR